MDGWMLVERVELPTYDKQLFFSGKEWLPSTEISLSILHDELDLN